MKFLHFASEVTLSGHFIRWSDGGEYYICQTVAQIKKSMRHIYGFIHGGCFFFRKTWWFKKRKTKASNISILSIVLRQIYIYHHGEPFYIVFPPGVQQDKCKDCWFLPPCTPANNLTLGNFLFGWPLGMNHTKLPGLLFFPFFKAARCGIDSASDCYVTPVGSRGTVRNVDSMEAAVICIGS